MQLDAVAATVASTHMQRLRQVAHEVHHKAECVESRLLRNFERARGLQREVGDCAHETLAVRTVTVVVVGARGAWAVGGVDVMQRASVCVRRPAHAYCVDRLTVSAHDATADICTPSRIWSTICAALGVRKLAATAPTTAWPSLPHDRMLRERRAAARRDTIVTGGRATNSLYSHRPLSQQYPVVRLLPFSRI